MFLEAVPISPADCETLIQRLRLLGLPAEKSAAAIIEEGVERDLFAVWLPVAEQSAVLAVLEPRQLGVNNQEMDALAELRASLLISRGHRATQARKRADATAPALRRELVGSPAQ